MLTFPVSNRRMTGQNNKPKKNMNEATDTQTTNDKAVGSTGLFGVAWQPITSAPKDGTRFLMAGIWHGSKDTTVITLMWWGTKYGDVCGELAWQVGWGNQVDQIGCLPTHWMPLPVPPNVKDQATAE